MYYCPYFYRTTNEKYFRPSKFKSINTRDLNNFILENTNEDPSKIILPEGFTDSSLNTLINFFSILREANQGASNEVGCGTVGLLKLPYPIAYAFLSKELQSQLSYDEFLKLFKNIYHINLIKMIKLQTSSSSNNIDIFLIEIETIEGLCFCYYYGYFEVKKGDAQYRINTLEFIKEDFFCAPYHGWQHNAESKVEIMYGSWCKLIAKQYPTEQKGYIKKIVIDGTEGNQYMFVFFELTNGTDIEIKQYKKTKTGQWSTTYIDPYKCLG